MRLALDRLADVGATWAPRFLDLDGDEEVLSWLPGQTIDDWSRRTDLLDGLTTTVRQLHDVTADLASGHDCLVHDDLQPRNVVVDGRRLGVIDWEQLRPGRRIEDVAQLCWSFATGPSDREVDAVGARWRRVVDVYGSFIDRSDIVPFALAKIGRCVDDIVREAGRGSERHRRLLDRGDCRDLEGLHDWIETNRGALLDLVA